jgi:hypothetical protein
VSVAVAYEELTRHEEGTRIDEEGPALPAARMAASDSTDTGRSVPLVTGATTVVAGADETTTVVGAEPGSVVGAGATAVVVVAAPAVVAGAAEVDTGAAAVAGEEVWPEEPQAAARTAHPGTRSQAAL